jgi:hypothetical protein
MGAMAGVRVVDVGARHRATGLSPNTWVAVWSLLKGLGRCC